MAAAETGELDRSAAGPQGRVERALEIVVLAVVVGLLTGLVEALVLWVGHAFFDRVVFVSEQVLFMAPLAYALVFAVLGVAMAVAALVAPKLMTLRVAAFGSVAFGFGCLLLPYSQIHKYAQVLLAAGVGAQAYHLAGAGRDRFWRVLRSSVAGLSLAALFAGAVTWAAGRDAPSAEARAEGPNVLLIVWDVVRAQSLSVYGYERPTTPGLEALAETGVVFDRAFATSPWTLPSHATMFTGLEPGALSTSWFRALDGLPPTVAEAFAGAGYRTAGFVANHHYTSYDSGLDRGFQTYRDYPVSFDQLLRSSAFTQTMSISRFLRAASWGERWRALRELNFYVAEKRSSHRKHAADVNGELLEWLDGGDQRPFFAFLNYFDAHLPYWSPAGTRERFRHEDMAVEGYDAAIAYLDAQVTELMAALSERGLLENTVVVVTSDHGELFGENNLYGHAHNLYRPVLHVPLIVRGPGVPGGRRVPDEVSLVDLGATFLDLAGVDAGAIPGKSLRGYWEDGGTTQAALPGFQWAEVEQGRNTDPNQPISRGPMKALIRGGFHYILNGDGREELYRYDTDPTEGTNLVDRPEHAELLAAFRREIGRRAPGAAPGA